MINTENKNNENIENEINNDEYQDRYLLHQENKKNIINGLMLNDYLEDKVEYTEDEITGFINILKNRRSQRLFNEEPLSDIDFKLIIESIRIAPSSCNRQTIYAKEVIPEEIEPLLVGGRNWIDKADKVILLFADKKAYKSPNEKLFMPYLDGGFVGQNIYLICESLGIGCCFVNPNIREENKESFMYDYGDDYFVGAFALGYYDKKIKRPKLRSSSTILRK